MYAYVGKYLFMRTSIYIYPNELLVTVNSRPLFFLPPLDKSFENRIKLMVPIF